MNSNSVAPAANKRLMSIDALRGFDMFWIIGGYYIFTSLQKISDNSFTAAISKQLSHTQWEGYYCYDTIMPLFLFIVGVAMPFSFSKRLSLGQSKKTLYFHVIRRVLILWVLGMMVQGNLLAFDSSKLYLYSNTLQAIAAGYLISSILILHFNIIWQFVISAGFLILFWALMMFVPFGGYPAGTLEPKANLAFYIDQVVLGRFDTGSTYAWVLSSMTFASTVMMGVLAGHLLHSKMSEKRKVSTLLIGGAISIILGCVWGIWFPIIKHIWTSSFVLFSGGICLILLGLFYLVIDVWGYKKWAFGFVVIGMNAIAVYMATELFQFTTIANIFLHGLEKWLGNYQILLLNTAAFAIVWSILYWMYKKKSFIKI